MSQPSRPRAHGPAKRRRRMLRPEAPIRWSSVACWRRFVPTFPLQATFTAATTPTDAFLGTVTVSQNTTATAISTSRRRSPRSPS